jgi:hypothetical protein
MMMKCIDYLIDTVGNVGCSSATLGCTTMVVLRMASSHLTGKVKTKPGIRRLKGRSKFSETSRNRRLGIRKVYCRRFCIRVFVSSALRSMRSRMRSLLRGSSLNGTLASTFGTVWGVSTTASLSVGIRLPAQG